VDLSARAIRARIAPTRSSGRIKTALFFELGTMNREKRQSLEAAGFVFEDAEDFLELTTEERRLVELRLALCRAVRARRTQQHLTQEQLARRLKSSQSRVAKMEAGSSDVSLDLLFRGLFVLGGRIEDLQLAP
jgi:predicted XRE-type DNA-binding protein